ncbi:MAG TPA: hypothetical protein VHN77_00580, partial [Phycisphaerales bacterium]|nr:hypothetical protein [Phycisphaerales bacterium]
PPTPPAHFAAPARGQMLSRVLLNWPRTGGKLDLNRAPFRLVAIVNRIDLADNPSYGGGSQSAGEGRFVFGVYDMSTATPCDMLPFSIIFEYGVRANGCSGLKNWAQQWVALSSHALGTPAYNNALEAITQQFVSANAAPSKPNGSALNQLRTNENGLNILWELREFRINASTHRLFEDTTAQTIDETLNGSTRLRNYVNSNEIDILNDAHDVPDLFPTATGGTAPFKSTHSLANNPPTTLPSQLSTIFAASGITNNLARHHFSLNTCTGCHIRETSTRFLHIDPTTTPITLSRFMTGATSSISDTPDPFNVTDPVVSSTTHAFNDIDRRRQKLAAIAGSSCFRFILVPPRLRDLKFRIPLDGPLPEIDPIGPIADDFFDPVRMPH